MVRPPIAPTDAPEYAHVVVAEDDRELGDPRGKAGLQRTESENEKASN